MASAIEQFKHRAKIAREKTTRLEQGVVRKATIASTGAALAFADKKNMPVQVFGVPTKLAIAGAGIVGELMTRGATQRFIGAVTDATLAVYSYKGVESGSFVAGMEGVSGGDL